MTANSAWDRMQLLAAQPLSSYTVLSRVPTYAQTAEGEKENESDHKSKNMVGDGSISGDDRVRSLG